MRKACLEMVYEMAKQDERIFFIGSDLGVDTLMQFKEEMPDRFFVEGISESHVVGLAAGLAMEGKIVYVNTIATFLSRRCFEQIVLDGALHKTNIRLIANGGGLVYAPLGPTHLAIDDIAILRAVPNMTILAPADADEMKRLMPLTIDHQGPMYIRLAKGYDPIVTDNEVPLQIGKAVPYGNGSDVLIITTGIGLRVVKEAAELLKGEDVGVTILHNPTIKPLDERSLLQYAQSTPVIVTVEEHLITGGLGSAIAEILMEADYCQPKKFKRIGIPDTFADEYGTQNSLMEKYGISVDNIVSTVKQLRDETLKLNV